MGEVAKISPRVPSTYAHNAILSLLIVHIIPSHQINMGINNPSLVSFVFSFIPTSYIWSFVCAANDDSHAENSQSNRCR